MGLPLTREGEGEGRASSTEKGDKMPVSSKINDNKSPKEAKGKETSRESPSYWKSPASCIVNIADFLKKAKCYAHLVKADGLIDDVQEFKVFEKRMVSFFVVDKRTFKICRSMKDTVIKSLLSLGIKLQRTIKGSGFFMRNVLQPTAEHCLEMAKKVLITKDLILNTEYEGRQRTRMAVFEVPPQ